MGTAADIVAEVERARDVLEKTWCLPWSNRGGARTIWENGIVGVLERLENPVLDETVELLLDHPSYAIKGLALHLVAARRRRVHAPRAVDLLAHASVHVRAMAAAALGKVSGEEAIEALLETKDCEHPEVKKAVVDALKQLADTRCIPLLARWIGRVGEDDELRRKACEALGTIGDDAAMPVLSRVLDDETVGDDVRGDAARAIGNIGGSEAKDLLRKGLTSRRQTVRATCIRVLSGFKDRSLVAVLAHHLSLREAPEVRLEAVMAIARLGGAEAVRRLVELAGDPDRRVRREVCVALGGLGGSQAVSALRSFLGDADQEVLVQALGAISRISGQDFGLRPEGGAVAVDAEELRQAADRARAHAD